MKENSTPFKNSRTSKIVFILSIIASGFWWLAKGINVYSDAIVGAIFELLWLPVLGMLFLLPIMSLVLLVKERFNLRSLFIYSILIGMATIFFMIFGK
jgi:apolipoprotein N-acyltransferase